MAETSKFIDIVLIWLFAGAIIALGAKELQQRYSGRIQARSGDVQEMLRALHGEVNPGRAMLKVGRSETRSETKSETKEKYTGDQLNRTDRQELDQLLNEF